MTRWWPLLLILLPGGSLLACLAIWRRRRREDHRADLVPRWSAFIQSANAKGEPRIPSARVPPVKALKAEKTNRFARFKTRLR